MVHRHPPGQRIAGQLACTRSPIACCRNTARAGRVSAASRPAAESRRQRRTDRHRPSVQSRAMRGVARPAWLPTSSARCWTAAAGCQSPVRPPCLAKLAQPCAAFHQSTGAKQARKISSTLAVSPIPNQITIHAGRPVAISRPSPAMAAVQNSRRGVSGVSVTAPAPSSRVALSSVAAGSPTRRPGNRSFAACISSSVPKAAASGASRRMPHAPCPANIVPARIQSATMGGWSR